MHFFPTEAAKDKSNETKHKVHAGKTRFLSYVLLVL